MDAIRETKEHRATANSGGHHTVALQIARKALARDPENERLRIEMARLLRLTGAREEAIEAYQTIAAGSNNATPHLELGALLRDMGRYKEAEAAFDALARINPDHPQLPVEYVTVARLRGDSAAALEIARKALARDPENERLRIEMARLLRLTGAREEAIEAYQTIAAGSNNATPHLELGALLRDMGRYKEAEAAFDALARINPDHPQLPVEYVTVARLRGDFAAALEIARKALARDPENERLRIEMARLLRLTGAREEAIEAYQTIAAGSNNATPHLELGALLRDMGRYKEAEAAFDALARINPDHPQLPVEYVTVARLRGDFAAALEIARKALARDPENERLRIEMARLLRLTGAREEAIEAYQTIAAGSNNATPHLELGALLRDMGRYKEAEEEFAAAERIQAHDPRILLERSELLAATSGRDFALAVVQQKVDQLGIDNVDPRLLRSVARKLIEFGQGVSARPYAERLIGTTSDQTEARLLAARAAAAAGDHAAARAHFAHVALQNCPRENLDNMSKVLQELCFSTQGFRPLLEIAANLQVQSEFSEHARGMLDLIDGKTQSIIDRGVEAYSPGKFNWRSFALFCSACAESGDYQRLRSALLSLEPSVNLNWRQIQQLLERASVLDDEDVERFLSRKALDLVLKSPSNPQFLILQLRTCRSADDYNRAAAAVTEYFYSGRADKILCIYMAVSGAKILDRIEQPDIATSFENCLPLARERINDYSILPIVMAERQLVHRIYENIPRTQECLVSILAPVHRKEDLSNLKASIDRQTWRNLEVIVVANGPLYDDECVVELLRGLPNLNVVHRDKGNLGSYLNTGVSLAKGEYIVRFDADDIYLPHYIESTIQAMVASGVEISTRRSYFTYYKSIEMVMLRARGGYFVEGTAGFGASMCFQRRIFDHSRFPESVKRGEDYIFCADVSSKGARGMILDPFDMIVVRQQDKQRHTWHVDDFAFSGDMFPLGSGEVITLLSRK